jgi:hypothetical protein
MPNASFFRVFSHYVLFLWVFFCLFFGCTGFELRASCMPGRSSTTQVTLPALSVLVIFETESGFMPRTPWTMSLLFVLFHVAGMTGIYHHTNSIGWDRVFWTCLPGLASNYHPSDLSLKNPGCQAWATVPCLHYIFIDQMSHMLGFTTGLYWITCSISH